MQNRAKFLKKCKEVMGNAGQGNMCEVYVNDIAAEAENKRRVHGSVGDAVITEDKDKNRNYWKLGIIENLIEGPDGVVTGAKIRTVKRVLERAVH